MDNKNTKFKTSYVVSKLTTGICRFSEKWNCVFVRCIGEVLLYASVCRIAPYRRRVGRYWICDFLYFAVL